MCSQCGHVNHMYASITSPKMDMVLLLSCRCLLVPSRLTSSNRQQAPRHCLVKGTMLPAALPR